MVRAVRLLPSTGSVYSCAEALPVLLAGSLLEGAVAVLEALLMYGSSLGFTEKFLASRDAASETPLKHLPACRGSEQVLSE